MMTMMMIMIIVYYVVMAIDVSPSRIQAVTFPLKFGNI